jgi:hypothetical protein
MTFFNGSAGAAGLVDFVVAVAKLLTRDVNLVIPLILINLSCFVYF